MAELETKPTGAGVEAFPAAAPGAGGRQDACELVGDPVLRTRTAKP